MQKVVINDSWKEMFNQNKDVDESNVDNEIHIDIDENT